MKSTAVLQKNSSGLTTSTIDDSIEKMMASCSFGSEVFNSALLEDQLIAAECQRSNGNFFLCQQFSKITRETTVQTPTDLHSRQGTATGPPETLPQEEAVHVKEKAKIETVFSEESSESDLSDSDDKLHKAFNIDPVLTMMPRVRKRDSVVSGLSCDLLSVEEELKKKYQTLQMSEQKAINVSKKRSLRVDSKIWDHVAAEKAVRSSLPEGAKERGLSREANSNLAELKSFCSPTFPRRGKPSLQSIDSPLSRLSFPGQTAATQPSSPENRIDLDRIVEVGKTALYIKNIPNKYTKKMLLKLFDRDFRHTYDFFYLPIDFNNNCNIGFAFIKFTDVKYVRKFCEKYGNKRWPHFNSEKICEIRYARMQKAEEMLEHFKNSSLWRKADASCLPFISSVQKPHAL